MTSGNGLRAAVYARVSTFDQEPENQLAELRRYIEARGWTAVEYVDTGISGAKDRRPALDALLLAARRRKVDVVVCWRLDRLGRNLRHLVVLLEELEALGVAFVSLNEGIDATTPAGRLQMAVLGAIAQFERERIAERVRAGLARAKAQEKRLGRPRLQPAPAATGGLSVRQAAAEWGVSKSTATRWIIEGRNPSGEGRADVAPAVDNVRVSTAQSWVVVCLAVSACATPAGQLEPELPTVDRIPFSERMWTVQISNGVNEAFPGEFRQLTRVRGDASSVTGLTADAWYACQAKNLRSAQYRIASLHAAPTASSSVVASIFEERRVNAIGEPEFVWTVERTSNPGVPVVWPDAEFAFDYGLHVAGVQRRGNWVRLLTSIPVDGWLRITTLPEIPDDAPVYVYIQPLTTQIVNLSPLTAQWPDGRKGTVQEGAFLIQQVVDRTIEFREEIPSDFACGEQVTDPVPLPPTLRAPASEFFNPDGTPR